MPIELEVVLVAVSAEAAACKLAEAREQNSHSERYIPLSNDHIVISQQALSALHKRDLVPLAFHLPNPTLLSGFAG
jgi:hypothetical protein